MIDNQAKLAKSGSQKWLQIAVNEKPYILNKAILKQLPDAKNQNISWLSPIKSDNYAEYRDNGFLKLLNIKLPNRSLSSFWPRLGPQWDGLGKTSNGDLLLVEAKSHISEICSPPSGASEKSLEKIRKSFSEVQKAFRMRAKYDWTHTFYQYANRIAHLYLLRELNNQPAYLILLGFLNDKEMNGPTSKEEWHGAIKLLETYLGLPEKHKLSDYILHVYLDIKSLQ
jgi:hypothetical protein